MGTCDLHTLTEAERGAGDDLPKPVEWSATFVQLCKEQMLRICISIMLMQKAIRGK